MDAYGVCMYAWVVRMCVYMCVCTSVCVGVCDTAHVTVNGPSPNTGSPWFSLIYIVTI